MIAKNAMIAGIEKNRSQESVVRSRSQRRWLLVLLVLLICAPVFAQMPDAAYRAEFKKWDAEQAQDLKDNWLPLIGLFWLKEGENTFGSAKGSAVELPASSAPPNAGVLIRHGDEVTIKVAGGAKVTSEGKPVTEQKLAVVPKPTKLELGSLRMFIVKREERIGLRVKDMKSPAIAQFKGLQYYPLSKAYILTADVVPGNGRTMIVPNVLGDKLKVPMAAEVRFKINGKEQTLEAMEGSDGGLFIVFSDLTKKGGATYPGGRFVETAAPKDGKVLLDFNKAYSPPCAWTPYATCPLPPKENQLQVEIPAGEKYTGHH